MNSLKPSKRQRLDQRLVDGGFADSRSRAAALCMSGNVLVDDRPVTKPGTMVAMDAALRLKGSDHPWVSRGGLKLAKALEVFTLDVSSCVCADIGASTGGFTDVLLTRGAARVYAVDVGHGQLAWKLRQDSRVTVLEKTNARHLSADHIPESLDVLVCDASFISLQKVLPAAMALVKPGGLLVALIKPQFEAQRQEIGKGGVVRDEAVHSRVCAETRQWLDGCGWTVQGICDSPITGPSGNREFLIAARRGVFAPCETPAQAVYPVT